MKFREIVEAVYSKNNADNSVKGRFAAHKEIGDRVTSLIEQKKIEPNKVSMKQLWEETVVAFDLQEGIVSSAFPTIAGSIISSVIIQAYQDFPKQGLQLVRTVPSKLKISNIVGWQAMGAMDKILEREDIKEVIPNLEKTQTIKNFKYAGLVSLTREDIFFDQTGDLMDRANGIGNEGARKQDEILLKKMIDADSDALSGAALYTSGNSNLNTANGLGTSGWEKVDQILTTKTDEQGKPIWVFSEKPTMMVAAKNKHVAWRLKNNEHGTLNSGNLDANPSKDAFNIVVNPYFTTPKTNTDWLYGNFKRQFRWEEVWPMQTAKRAGQNTDRGFHNDIFQETKASFFGGAGSIDTRFVEKNTA